jgi:hypothetical protein
MTDYQRAIDQVEDLDLDEDRITALIMAIYGGAEIEESGGYDGLIARREARVDPEYLREAGWAEPAEETGEEGLPLTESGAGIYHYYHERAKGEEDLERVLNTDPKEFARRALEWWYEPDTAATDEN